MRHMKNVLAALAMIGLITSCVQARTYSQKTFIAPRPIGFYSPMEYTTWHDHVYNKRKNPNLHTHFMVTGFYADSQNNNGLGKYFGAGDGKLGFTVGTDPQVTAETADVWNQLLIKDNNADDTLAGKITFSPEQEMWGARLDFFQDVFKPFDSLYFKASLPIVYVQNTVKMKVTDGHNTVMDNKTFTLEDFFAGRVDNSNALLSDGNANNNQLNPLKYAKIDGRRSKTGATDLDLSLGYKFHKAEKSHFFGALTCLVPLGNRPRGEYLFEPVLGNGRHVGLGASIDAGASLWNSKRADLSFLMSLNYKYLLECGEKRTLPVKNAALTNSKNDSYSYYLALGKKDQTNKPLDPAANIFTRDVSVRPGNMFDGMIELAFKSSGFTIDLGYNLYFKDKESVKLPNFEDGVYGIAYPSFETSGSFTSDQTYGFLTKNDIQMTDATTPWQTSHNIFAGFGYTCKMYKKYPASVGLGGSYEFVNDNAALERAMVWVKAAFSF